MTIGRVRMGQEKIFRKLARRKVLLQQFNNNCVLAKEGRVSVIEKPDGHRIKTGQLCLEIIDYRFDY
jgi:hypothetical protein